MQIKRVLPLLAISVLAVAAVFGAATNQKVSAQTPEPTQTAPTTPAAPGRLHEFKGGMLREGVDTYLAEALGITTDQLSAACTTAMNEALAQAVADGKLTQAQADQLAERGFGRLEGFWLKDAAIDQNALLAKALNISVEQLDAARQKAFAARIDAAVADGKLTQEQADLMKGRQALGNSSDFQSAMQSAFEAAVNQAVQSGLITQAQADQILKNMNPFGMHMQGFGGSRGKGMMPEFGGLPGKGGFGGHGRGGGFTPRGSNNGSNGTTVPSTPSTSSNT